MRTGFKIARISLAVVWVVSGLAFVGLSFVAAPAPGTAKMAHGLLVAQAAAPLPLAARS
jgi:hypothetical protein